MKFYRSDYGDRLMDQLGVEPFLRWAGGKRWLAKILSPLLREMKSGIYMEPFLGSGAIFFSLCPNRAIISDLNADLINTYQQVTLNPTLLQEHIRSIPVNAEEYYRIRSNSGKSDFDRALRFLYLNRTCYGGIYRENRAGKFNTPYGGGSRTPTPLWQEDLLIKAQKALGKPGVQLLKTDFESVIKRASSGDLVYCDPPYHPVTPQQFNRYGSVIFGWKDQIRLASAALAAYSRGALVVISNTYCSEIRELYPNAYRLRLEKNRSIAKLCRNPELRSEYFIVLDPFEQREHWAALGKIERYRSGSSITNIQAQLDRRLESAST